MTANVRHTAGPIRVLRRACAIALVLALAACAERPGPGRLKATTATAPDAQTHRILIVTTRERDARRGTYFSGERAAAINYAAAEVSVPPTHAPSAIEWPTVPPGDPAKDFTLRAAGHLEDGAAFRTLLRGELAKRPPDKREAFLFIHGYNTRFPEALYRFTQVVHDARVAEVPVLFTWASRGDVTDYVYDVNSAHIARDSLEQTLRDIAASGATRINILAHSMGGYLLLETLRQMSISPNELGEDRFGLIVLAAPDIDIDLFKEQLKRVGKRKRPFMILVSKDDRALKASSLLAGGKQRVGRYENTEELAELGAIVVDLTEIDAATSANHDKFAQFARIAPELRTTLAQSKLGRQSENTAAEGTLGELIGRGANAVLIVPKTILQVPVVLLGGQ